MSDLFKDMDQSPRTNANIPEKQEILCQHWRDSDNSVLLEEPGVYLRPGVY